ncbi:hypothetical protein A9R00_10670 [Oleispira antarctica]|uniref:Uncharacterized protein n=1 Tax=Oleispira antarctica TaxID=188908 RepID=A0A1Y5HR10_OLEAN|nr:hypothetical protein A9R00_10670 [Oleispira antarctica]
MKNILILMLLLIAMPGQSDIISRNLVGTGADILLTKNYQEDTGMGEIEVQLCSSCTNYKLTIDSQTKALRRDEAITLIQLKMYLNANRKAPMRVQFNKHTKQVFYISLQPKNKE